MRNKFTAANTYSELKMSSSSSVPDSMGLLPLEPHQPQGFPFPKREFGKKNVVRRSFQSSWFGRWPWIHYMEATDSVVCIICARASREGKLQWSTNADSAFITKGFCNWKDGTVKFNIHDSSKCHKEAVLKMNILPSTTPNVAECLSQQLKKDKLDRRQCFLKILSNLKFLARQGMINGSIT